MENQKNTTRSPSPKRLHALVSTSTIKPSMYQVVLMNDEVTPRDYVVQCLEEHFFKATDAAHSLMFKIQEFGEAACGRYTREMAETKIAEVIADARRNNHPLKCVMRKIK